MNQGMNSQQNNGGNTQRMRPRGVNTNEPVQPNIYYNQTNLGQQYQSPTGGQVNNGYAPNHNVSANQQPSGNGKQVLWHNPGPLNTRDVKEKWEREKNTRKKN